METMDQEHTPPIQVGVRPLVFSNADPLIILELAKINSKLPFKREGNESKS